MPIVHDESDTEECSANNTAATSVEPVASSACFADDEKTTGNCDMSMTSREDCSTDKINYTAETIPCETMMSEMRAFINSSNLNSYTRKLVRSKLEEIFGFDENALWSRRMEINKLLVTVVNEVLSRDEANKPSPEENASDLQPPKSKRMKLEHGRSSGDDETDGDNDEEDSVSSVSEADDEEEGEYVQSKKRKPTSSSKSSKAVPKQKGVKKSQQSLMTRVMFIEEAKPFKLRVGELGEFDVAPRRFATGSCGWFFGSKQELPVGVHKAMCQITFNCTIVGSKQWKEGKSSSSKQHARSSNAADDMPAETESPTAKKEESDASC